MNFFLTLLLSLLITIGTSNIANGCFEEERHALLTFKAGLNDPGKLMFSWHGQHCCNWSGVTCDRSSEHIVKLKLGNPYSLYSYPYNYSTWKSHALTGKINPALLSLEHLTHLDLSNHNFSDLSIPSFIASFENLVYLNLSSSGFQGVIPYELGNLFPLQYLDLSNSHITGSVPAELGNLSQLQYLDLSNCFLNGSVPAQLGNLSDLRYLNLGDNYNFQVINIASWLFRLSNLRHLDMSFINLNNTFDWSAINKMDQLETLILLDCRLSEIPIDLSHANLTHLTKLDLSYNSFHVTLPNWLWNLTSLSYLDLTNSDFRGNISHDLSNLGLLNYLAIGWNNLEHVQLESISNLYNLRTLDLSSLGIEGNIINLIKRLGPMWYSLEVVYLWDNNLSGNISSWIAQMKNLSSIDLSSNSLSGHISSDIGTLAQLKELYLFNNSLSGVITEAHFANLSNLVDLDLSNNILTVNLNGDWVPPFHLEYLSLSSCRVGPRFPSWLLEQKQLVWVDLSNTSIIDALPTWFWNLPLELVGLSYNNIRGNLPTPFLLNNILVLNLRSNNISGQIPSIHGEMIYLDLSENQINGSIPYSICEMAHLEFFILSNNAISGKIPSCWKNISILGYIDLSNNKITGELPFSIGSLQYLTILQLYNNKLYGEIPSCLQQCTSLLFLSLGRNNFSGNIPSWTGKRLQSLAVLQLRSNNFSGFIPQELGELSSLQIVDLAHNSLVGPIPNSFGNFSSMINTTRYFSSSYDEGSINYEVALYIDINGEQVYTSKPLDYAKTIDISGNNLIGQIPDEIWLLEGVINLNLSKNHLIGEIPEIVGGMRSLESLGLSFNNLCGILPQALSSLFSLHSLNLSYNNFSGNVPTGRQLDTLSDPSIYAGNSYLCGPLIDKYCFENHAPISSYSIHGDNGSGEIVWFYLVFDLGFVFGFWTVWGVLIFQNAWKVAYFRMVDRSFDKIYVHTVIAMRRLG